jgi:hypothetical protein
VADSSIGLRRFIQPASSRAALDVDLEDHAVGGDRLHEADQRAG